MKHLPLWLTIFLVLLPALGRSAEAILAQLGKC